MSFSDLVAFAVSGSTATALAALVTDRLAPDERRGRPRHRPAAAAADSQPLAATAARSAANGLIFFFTYYVAATTRASATAPSASSNTTQRAASDAFWVGATASVFTRLFGPRGPRDPLDDATAPAGHRWSLPALEDDFVLAVDPGLTFCVHELLARSVAGMLSRRQQKTSGGLAAAITTFLLAATSKAVAAGLTHPLHAAAAEAAEARRRSTAAAEVQAEADVPLIILEDEEETGGWAAGRPHAAAAAAAAAAAGTRLSGSGRRRQHCVLVVLLQMLRASGVRSLYVDWLRAVVTAALGHGLTMALQRSIYGFVLRFMYSAARSRRGRPSAEGMQRAERAERTDRTVRGAPEAAPSVQAPPEAPPARAPLPLLAREPDASPLEAPAPVPASVRFPDEERSKAKRAVESWLEASSVASEGTVDVGDSVSNISARPRAPARLQRQPRQAPVRAAPSRAPSRASEPPPSSPPPFYPRASPAAVARHTTDVDSHDFGDDNGSLIFNMVSKSPRVIKGRDDDF